jgi:outer membrane protein TolC
MKIVLPLLLCALAPAAALGQARPLRFPEAVALGLRVDPATATALIAEDRARLAVLRAQLDRVSLKIDGSLQELFTKSNIGGPTLFRCTIAGVSFSLDPETCAQQGGVAMQAAQQSPEQGIGTFNVAANLSVPIFSGLRVESNVKRTQKLRDASTAGIRHARRDVALAVARAYWSVRRLGLLFEVQAAALGRLAEAVEVTGGRVKAGLAPPIDENRARLRRLQRAAQVADLEGQLREASAQLAVALGLREDVVLVDAVPVHEGRPPPAEELLVDARRGRADLALSRLNAEAQRQAVRMALSGYMPQLTGFLLFQVGNNQFNPISGVRGFSQSANPFSNLSGSLTTGFTLSMNFFDTLHTWTAHRDARYEEARLWEESRRVGRLVEADVRAAHARVEKLIARRAPLVEALEVARDNLAILEARYKNGDALVIEYLDGQIERVNAELELADVTAQLHLAWLELEAALGRTVGDEP